MDLLNLVFIIFSLIAVSVLCFYFYRLAQHDKEQWFKKEVENIKKEQDAEEWLAHSFVPDVIEYSKQKPKKIIKYTFFALIATVFLWSYFIEGFYFAARNTFFFCVIYSFAVLYIYTEPRFFSYLKNHLPRKMRHNFDNDWIRAYVFFLLPGGIVSFFIFQPFSLWSFLFSYTSLFLVLIAATKVSMDIGKEEDHHKKKLAKKILEE